jgi:hypothetical protein
MVLSRDRRTKSNSKPIRHAHVEPWSDVKWQKLHLRKQVWWAGFWACGLHR